MMRFHQRLRAGLVLLVLLALGCDNNGRDRVLGLDAVGVVAGTVFFDWNGTRQMGDSVVPLKGVDVLLVDPATGDTMTRAVSGEEGEYNLPDLPVGRYIVRVDEPTMPDTVQVVRITDADVVLAPDDSVTVLIALGFPAFTVLKARRLSEGVRLFVDGVALNGWDTFGDSTLHLTDSTGAAIRAVKVEPVDVAAGDSVRIRGMITRNTDSLPLVDHAIAFRLAAQSLDEVPGPGVVSTGVAATADGGRLDAAQVRIVDAAVMDTTSVAEGFRAVADDGSGPLTLLFDGDIGFAGPLIRDVEPGATVTVTGILVHDSPATWVLKPRFNNDIEVVEAPSQAEPAFLRGSSSRKP